MIPLSEYGEGGAYDRALERLARSKVEPGAVCLLHAYANGSHERAARRAARRRLPGVPVSLRGSSPRA